MKNCALHELETVVARLVRAERSDQGHYSFPNRQLLWRFLYNHAGFEWDESVDPSGLSLLIANPTITLRYKTSRAFDMEERDVPPLYHDPPHSVYVRDTTPSSAWHGKGRRRTYPPTYPICCPIVFAPSTPPFLPVAKNPRASVRDSTCGSSK
jgi:hypothetical protein